MDLKSRWTHETAHRFISLTVWVGSALPALLQADLTLELTSNSADRIEIYSEAMDLSRFGSKILNLVMNAIDSMDSAEPRVLSVTSEIAGADGVRVSIADTGRGIDVANLNRIFQPMFTTKTRGMGMGLSIFKSVIESHNSHIWASANVPRGSIFQFELAANGAKH
jgi:signal transduction histidine kinase